MRVGCHVSIKGTIDVAVDRAQALGCQTFQIFTRNPRQWQAKALSHRTANAFITKVKALNMAPLFAHMPYLSNLASPRDLVYWKSIATLKTELQRCRWLHIPYLVTHLGSHLGYGFENGFKRIIYAIDTAMEKTNSKIMLLLENTAGTRNSIGSTFQDIQKIIEHTRHSERIGVCLDTSHAFAAGYDLRTKETINHVLADFDCIIGFTKLKLIHLNDSGKEYNSHVDHHYHIGLGKIGVKGFRNLLASKIRGLPLILETPQDSRRSDKDNLRTVIDLSSRKS